MQEKSVQTNETKGIKRDLEQSGNGEGVDNFGDDLPPTKKRRQNATQKVDNCNENKILKENSNNDPNNNNDNNVNGKKKSRNRNKNKTKNRNKNNKNNQTGKPEKWPKSLGTLLNYRKIKKFFKYHQNNEFVKKLSNGQKSKIICKIAQGYIWTFLTKLLELDASIDRKKGLFKNMNEFERLENECCILLFNEINNNTINYNSADYRPKRLLRRLLKETFDSCLIKMQKERFEQFNNKTEDNKMNDKSEETNLTQSANDKNDKNNKRDKEKEKFYHLYVKLSSRMRKCTQELDGKIVINLFGWTIEIVIENIVNKMVLYLENMNNNNNNENKSKDICKLAFEFVENEMNKLFLNQSVVFIDSIRPIVQEKVKQYNDSVGNENENINENENEKKDDKNDEKNEDEE